MTVIFLAMPFALLYAEALAAEYGDHRDALGVAAAEALGLLGLVCWLLGV